MTFEFNFKAERVHSPRGVVEQVLVGKDFLSIPYLGAHVMFISARSLSVFARIFAGAIRL